MTGKPVGDDLREGKPTPLLALAHAAATPAQRSVLDAVGTPQLADDRAGVERVQQVLVDTGALAALEDRIARLTRTAVDGIAVAPISSGARDALIELAAQVAFREI